jgi:deazaflavin-dependent oxidoreductase (nitroreductase family)
MPSREGTRRDVEQRADAVLFLLTRATARRMFVLRRGGDVSDATERSQPKFRSLGWRVGNAIVGVFARAGVGPIQLLTTRGRTTGRAHTIPVVPVEHDGKTWLVAPYGVVAWVTNARSAGRVSLRYGRATRDFTVREASADEAGPVLKRYVAVATRTRARFRSTKDSPVEDFAAEADGHPVFELIPVRAPRV